MTKKTRRLNVTKGSLVPLGNGFSLAIGKHPEKTDDINIGPNNKNGLSVNHGEILQNTGDGVRVFSAEPFLEGVSPSQLLYEGANPNAVFAAQEAYKDANRLNDDGSHYLKGGKKTKVAKEQTKDKSIHPVKEGIDWSGIVTTNNRKYNADYIDYINKGLVARGFGKNQRAAILANIIEESGGNPFAVDSTGDFKGILQWEKSRYWPGDETDAYKELDNQIQYIADTVGNSTDRKSWTHGGKGSGYNSLVDAMAAYNSEDDLEATIRGYTLGYVRPAGGVDSYNNRLKVAQQIIDREGFKNGGIYIKPSKRGTFTAAAKKHGMSVQAFASKVLANKENYSSAMVKKANFARNAKKWHHLYGGEDTLINSLEERPNAKVETMKENKRNKAYTGTIDPFMGTKQVQFNNPYSGLVYKNGVLTPVYKDLKLSTINLPIKSSIDIDPFMGYSLSTFKAAPVASGTSNPTGGSFWNKAGNFIKSGTGMDLIGTGINIAGSLISHSINRHALDKLQFTPREYTLLDPVKLKTKINIAPELAKMRETVAGISNAARKTSASSRNAFQKIANARMAGLQSYMNLLGEKENKETALINQDLLNQQGVRHQNAKTVMDTVNYNIAGKDNLLNTKTQLKAQNDVALVNNLAGSITGERSLLARRDARRNQAANLAMMSLAYPDAARLMMGEGWEKAFNGYYNMLNNRIGV